MATRCLEQRILGSVSVNTHSTERGLRALSCIYTTDFLTEVYFKAFVLLSQYKSLYIPNVSVSTNKVNIRECSRVCVCVGGAKKTTHYGNEHFSIKTWHAIPDVSVLFFSVMS